MDFRAAILLVLVANALLVSGEAGDTLDELLTRLLEQLDSRQAGSLDSYLQSLIAESTRPSIDKAMIIGLDGKPLTSGNIANALQLTRLERAAIVGVMVSNRFDSWIANGMTAEGVTYRFMMEKDGVCNVSSGEEILTIQKGTNAIIVARSPAKGMENAKAAVAKIITQLDQN